MTQNTLDTETCNTKTIRSRAWCFTINNYSDDDLTFLEDLKSDLEDYAWQSEVGEKGTPHIQGCMKFKNARTFNALKKKHNTWHLEVPRKPWIAQKRYCQKDDTSDGLIADKKNTIKDPLQGLELYDWQKEIIGLIKEEPDNRSIHWYYDEIGCKGKTTLAKSLCINNKDCIYLTGKASDMKFGVYSYIKNNKPLRVVILDLVRSLENFVSYQGIEEIKNGIFYNTKYESEMCLYNDIHVIIFANFEPVLKKLSLDRWVIKEIK